jgi:two-component system sensor histidine kinase DctS
MLTPVFAERRLTGMLLAVYPLEALLSSRSRGGSPKNTMSRSSTTTTSATRPNRASPARQPELRHPLRPAGLRPEAARDQLPDAGQLAARLLIAAIIALAGGVFWSLWLVRDLMRKRSRAEEALRAEHAFRAAMEDSLTVGMRARDLDGRVIYVNPAFCRMTGFTAEELVGAAPPMPYWAPEQMEQTYAMHQTVLAGAAPQDGFEITFMRKDGERFQALVYEAKLIDGKGKHTGWMASVLDITERKHAEELARQQQEQLQFTARLVTMGEMASTLAHELNQPLAAIASYNTGCLNLLAQEATRAEDLRPALEKIGHQAQRAGKIIRRVHDFVRKSEPKRAPCAIGEVIEDCLGFIEPEARKRQVRIDCRIPPLPPVLADRVMLEQVLLNLIRNGMDAMADTPVRDRMLKLSAMEEGGQLRIAVTDNGCGIAPEIRDRLFTAFFSTKPDGMGIGLSICRSIVEFHTRPTVERGQPGLADRKRYDIRLHLPLEAP